MSAKPRKHPLYILFLLLMALLCAAGIGLMIYGSLHNGIPMPKLPGIAPHIAWYRHG